MLPQQPLDLTEDNVRRVLVDARVDLLLSFTTWLPPYPYTSPLGQIDLKILYFDQKLLGFSNAYRSSLFFTIGVRYFFSLRYCSACVRNKSYSVNSVIYVLGFILYWVVNDIMKVVYLLMLVLFSVIESMTLCQAYGEVEYRVFEKSSMKFRDQVVLPIPLSHILHSLSDIA